MLKITKGLKKKKKGKKSKNKEEDLFDSAELEQYRREQQQKQSTGSAETSEVTNSEKGEEWEKFKALTSGVDDILKKTQGDLDRIKSTSYFQKKTPGTSNSTGAATVGNERGTEIVKGEVQPKSKEKWVGFEDSVNLADEEIERRGDEVNQEEPKEEETVVVEEAEEEESELEDDQDDIFDTSYVDVVASGEVKLAYVPDSPIKEEEDSFDPFDTSIVDKVIKADPKKKNLVNLGCAVEVLTGKLEKFPQTSDTDKVQRRRPKTPQDLLLDSFDDDYSSSIRRDGGEVAAVVDNEPAPRSILDDDPIFAEETSAILEFPSVIRNCENNNSICSHSEKEKEKSSELDLKYLVEQFVCDSHTTPNSTEPSVPKEIIELVIDDELDNEFAALAAESLAKKQHKEIPSKPRKPPRPELPSKTIPITTQIELEFDEFDETGEDPFDTSFAAQILPGKFELKLIEKEILTDDNTEENQKSIANQKINIQFINSAIKEKFSFPVKDQKEQEPLSLKHRDLLGGSTTDLSKISQCPIVPKSIEINTTDLVNDDPFDTSIVNELVVPGKTELKFLEKELLKEENSKLQIEVDNDFDPRAEEILVSKLVSRPDNLKVGGGKRTSVPKIVAFDLKSPSNLPDLLTVGLEESAKINKPLTPYYPPNNNVSQDKSDLDLSIDPFDTSFVINHPGKLELKLIEQELTSGSADLKKSLSDPDFDPRAETETHHNNLSTISTETAAISEQPDIISEEVKIEGKLHTPVTPRKITEEFEEIEDFDPFDTSIANVLAPGKVEVKILETELIFAKENSPVNTINKIAETLTRQTTETILPVSDVLEEIGEVITVKPLTPTAAACLEEIDQEQIDPFDTSSIGGHILPGKTEIKLLESQLLN